MITIVDLKSNYIPIRKVGSKTIVSFGYEPVLKDGQETKFASWHRHMFTQSVTFRELKSFILEELNKETNKRILKGFVWKDIPVWLSTENQFNYKAAYDYAVQSGGANLPTVFKFGTTDNPIYYKFETVEELRDFYLKAMTYINEQLAIGWYKKDSIDWSIYENATK